MPSREQGQIELHRLIYTMNWEDPESDHKALKIQPSDTVMSITSGGCNTLGFLAYDPRAVYTVDINPSQSSLLELKIAAIRHLTHPEFIRFLGLVPSNDRLTTYGTLKKHLGRQSAQFWDHRYRIVEKGFLMRGRYEDFVKVVGKLIRLIQGKKRIDHLFDEKDLGQQKEYYKRCWDIRRTRLIFNLFFNKRVLARRGLEADYFHFDDGSASFAESFFRRFKKAANDIPIKDNYFLHLYLKGKYRSLDEAPNYLKRDHFEMIKQRADRISIVTDDAKRWLASLPDNTFDCLSLSNICELMDAADTKRMFQETRRTAKPGARVCFRNLMLPREVPEELRASIQKDEALSSEMMNTDRSFVYSKVAAYRVHK
jgi:S-adenosylmethionine-diacylglycerol 3-amino-3-carboxypropyl transferase